MLKTILISSLLFICMPTGQKTVLAIIEPHSPEILYGNVMQLIEIHHFHHKSDVRRSPFDTINFDKKGVLVERRQGDGESPAFITRYIVSYYGNRKIIGSRNNDTMICRFNYYGKPVELKSHKQRKLRYIDYYKYNIKGDLIECDSYSSNGSFFARHKFKYDNDHHLIEKNINLKNLDRMEISYRYESFDDNNNWTKKIISSNGFNAAAGHQQMDTVYRELTYY